MSEWHFKIQQQNMKVYSTVRNQRKSITLNQSLRNNIESLSKMVRIQTTPSLTLSPSIQSFDGEGEALTLAIQFVTALKDPYRAMLLYPLILDSPFAYTADPLFLQTSFPLELHSLLSLYLHKSSGYAQIERYGRRMVDIFYHFIAVEAPGVLEEWLNRNQKQSLGEWFYNECIGGFFQMVFRSKEDFTVFITNFLREGIAYVLLAAASAIKKAGPPEVEPFALERIRVSFVSKYKLDMC